MTTAIATAPLVVVHEAELAARFARDAEPLFEMLARRARRLTTCDADAEDLLQDTLLHAYQGFRSFRDGTNLKAWLFRILHNRWVSTHRYKQCRPTEFAVDDIGGWDVADQRCTETDVVETLSDSDVKRALADLPEGVRAVMYYAGVEGYTYAQTAALMGIPIGTVMSRVARGRQRLRVALAHLDYRADTDTPERKTA